MPTRPYHLPLEQHGLELQWSTYTRILFTNCSADPQQCTFWGWLNRRIGRSRAYGRPTICCTQTLHGVVPPPPVLFEDQTTFIGLFNDFPLNLGKIPNSLIWPNKSWHLPAKCQECRACHHCNKQKCLTHFHMMAKGTPAQYESHWNRLKVLQ